MARRVVVIASGETERLALPCLLAGLLEEGCRLVGVRIPPRGRALQAEVVEKLAKAAWYELCGTPDEPDKIVVVVDADGRDPDSVLEPLRTAVVSRLQNLGATLKFAAAQWHLEAWFFADQEGLRGWLQRALGSVDASKPDEIRNPKLHLRNLLGDAVYTSRLSQEIAAQLNPRVIVERSPSFAGVVRTVRNGTG